MMRGHGASLTDRRSSAWPMKTHILARIRVVDVETGERIDKVIAADAEAGTVTRYAVENGALVLENDRFKVIEESRAIAIEWLGTKRKNSF